MLSHVCFYENNEENSCSVFIVRHPENYKTNFPTCYNHLALVESELYHNEIMQKEYDGVICTLCTVELQENSKDAIFKIGCCGSFFHIDCFKKLQSNSPINLRFKCPVCRQRTNIDRTLDEYETHKTSVSSVPREDVFLCADDNMTQKVMYDRFTKVMTQHESDKKLLLKTAEKMNRIANIFCELEKVELKQLTSIVQDLKLSDFLKLGAQNVNAINKKCYSLSTVSISIFYKPAFVKNDQILPTYDIPKYPMEDPQYDTDDDMPLLEESSYFADIPMAWSPPTFY